MAEKKALGTVTNPDLSDLIYDDPMTPSEKEVLTYFEQCYMLSGTLPSRQKCLDAGFAAKSYDIAIRKQAFHTALMNRGILDRSSLKIQDGLTREQLQVANILLDFRDKRSDTKKLAEANITTAKYNGWLKDPVFQNYIRTRSEQVINENQRDINDALLNRARSGDIGAIKYTNQMTGYFDPDKKDVTDVNMVLMSVLDILQRHLSTNPEILSSVAEELLTLAEKATSSGMGVSSQRVITGSSNLLSLDSEPYSGGLDLLELQ
jgi:hypothetical protein